MRATHVRDESLSGYPVWLWPNILSLDAPLVAGAWYIALARGQGVSVELRTLLILIATVWTIYAADRVLDVRTGIPATARHRFARDHRGAFVAALPVVITPSAALSLLSLPGRFLLWGCIVAGATACYLVWVHRRGGRQAPEAKRVAVSALFAAGVVLPLYGSPGLGREWGAISAVVWLNLSAIDHWEASRETSRTVAAGCLATAVVCFCLGGVSGIYGGLECSAVLTGLLNLLRPRLADEVLRAAVDLALLLPAFASLL